MPCLLTAAECFRKYVVVRDANLGLKAGKDGWWSMPCPGRSRADISHATRQGLAGRGDHASLGTQLADAEPLVCRCAGS